jgi:hypothetical protein
MHMRNRPGRALREELPITTFSAGFSAVALSAAQDVFELVRARLGSRSAASRSVSPSTHATVRRLETEILSGDHVCVVWLLFEDPESEMVTEAATAE